MDLKIIRTESEDTWNNYLSQFEASFRHIYFTAEYHQMMEANGDGSAELAVIEEGDSLFFYPYMVNEISRIGSVSLPEISYDIQSVFGYTGPLFNSEDQSFRINAVRRFTDCCKERNIITELIRFNPLLHNETYIKNSKDVTVIEHKKNVNVRLSESIDTLFASYRQTTRNNIIQAKKDEDSVGMTNSNKIVFDEFVTLYKRHMEKIGVEKYYFFSENYFSALFDLVKKNGMLFYSKIDNKLVACIVFLFLNDTVYNHHNCRDIDYKTSGNLNKRLYHKAFEYFSENGATSCFLGGGSTENEDDSLLKFKRGFSKNEDYFYLGKRVINEDSYGNLCAIWENEFPGLRDKYSVFLEKYRLTE